MRLIDADALLKKVKLRSERIRKGDGFDFSVKETDDSFLNGALMPSTEWWCVEDLIENAPTIDAVEVVRCRNCKNWQEWENGTGSCHRSENGYNWFGVDATDYCSFGVRREDGE